MFTRRCSHQFQRWLRAAATSAKLLFAFVLLGSITSTGLFAADGPGKKEPGKPFFNFSVDFKQGANKDAPLLLGDIHWIGSILQSSNSRYAEGMSTLQRVVFLDLAPVASNNHVLRVKFEAQKATHHAYDFITGWNQALKAAHDLSGSEELMPDAQPLNSSALYDETEPRSLNVCGDAISADAGTRCAQLHDGVSFYDLPVSGETDLVIAGDASTTTAQIAAYEAAYGARTVRVWAPSLTGGAGSADNKVVFVKYEAGYIFYDIKWKTSVATADDAVIEFGAHIAKGIGGYGANQGASDINGGPYHVILDDLIGSTDNLGNQDNQLQGADIIVRPTCQLTGPTSVCAGAGNQNYTATVDALNNPVYTWSIINSNQTTPASIVSGQGQVANPLVVSPGSVGHYTVQFVVTNDGGTGLSSTCTVTTDVICSTPTIGGQGANATIECTASPSFTAPTTSDACGGSTVSTVGPDVSSGNSCLRTVTRTWRATNSCGNSSTTVSQTITIRDTQAPTIGSAGANATIECTASPSFTAPTASDACNGATVSTTGPDVTGGTACARTVTRTWRAVDACGNSSATRSQTITIVDTQAPTIGQAGANATVECTGTSVFTAPTASDACSGATVVIVGADVTGGSACTGTRTRTWVAVDACGNSSVTRSQTITISDNTAPVIGNAGDNATIECTASPSFTAPTATDACSGATVSIVGADVTGGTSCARTITRTWRAVDGCGNSSATRSQTITIVDSQAPTIGNAGANATIECTASPSFTAPTASDACDGATVSIVGSDVTGGTSCARTVTRTWRAVDNCGNSSATRSQTITIVDTQAPTIGNAGANATIECTASPSFTAPTASDACDGATVSIVGADVTGGTSCARTVTRTWRAVDNCGNTSATRSQTITIRDTQAPTIGQAGANATVECTATPSFTPPTASDACDGATVQVVSDQTTAGAGGSTVFTRVWRAVDNCGNSSTTRSQIITVLACPSALCTYTQGYYGNDVGTSCDGTDQFNTAGLIAHSLANLGGSLTVGCPGHSVTINNNATDIACLIDVLPGGGSSGALPAGDLNICNLGSAGLLKNGRINNALLAQTITLGLNLGINPPSLGNFALQANKWLVTADLVECGSETVASCTFNCVPDGLGGFIWTRNFNPYHVSCKISQAVYDALTTKNVSGLYALANSALCGNALPTGVTYSDITNAVDCINNAFDGCRGFIAWVAGDQPSVDSFCPLPSSSTPCPPVTTARPTSEFGSTVTTDNLTVTAYPNPFRGTVKFTIESNISGQASLEVYNSLGQRVSTVYKGYLQANRGQVVEYRASRLGSNLIYVLRVGSKSVTGKLLHLE
jgi:hypothetical protein